MPISPDQQAEIDALRAEPKQTLRAVSDGIEAHLYKAIPVLDHGFVRVIDYMGNDEAICQAAASAMAVARNRSKTTKA